MPKTWFTADTHFAHENIIKHCNRPFRNINSMDRTLIRNWNNRVDTNDLVIFLGDFGFKVRDRLRTYLDQLNGHITFVKGNHDNNNSLNTRIENLVIKAYNKLIYCVHNPSDFNSNYNLNLVGHVHEKWLYKEMYKVIMINVGVDVWKYSPVSLDEIYKVYQSIKLGKRKKKNKPLVMKNNS